MKKIVIMPGGFHPFHAGHMALYNAAREAFPSADVFVAATDDTSGRPFPFKTKKFLAQQAGVPGNRFIQVKSPFRAEEITQMYDPDDTVLIFARSDKDAQKPPQAGGVKKDGSAAYLQPYKRNGLEPFSRHGYMVYLPTVQFGPGMTSATEIRAKWPEMSPEEKIGLVKVLYPGAAAKDAAAGKIVAMLDEIMGGQPEVKEAVLINDPDAGHQIRPDGGMGTWDEASLRDNLSRKFASMLTMLKSGDYDRLHYVLQKGEVVDHMVRALAEYQAFMKKQGRRPISRGREIDMTDYLDEKKPMEETKSLSSFLAGTDAMVRTPANGARAEIFTAAQRAAIERFVPQARGQTDHELLQAGKEFLEKFLQRVKAGEELPRQDRRIVSGLYDIIRGQTDRYDNFVRQHNLDEN